MKCIHCGGNMQYDMHRQKVYTIKVDGVVVGITCRFCGWNHYKKKGKSKVIEEFDESEYS